MNDMEWGGIGDPEGLIVPGSDGADGAADRDGRRDDEADGAAEVDPDEAIAVATGHLWSCIKGLQRHEAALDARESGVLDPADLKEAVQSAKIVRDAVNHLMAERNRVDKLRKDIAGGVGGGCLDLDAARDEIGRRLACLRHAAGG